MKDLIVYFSLEGNTEYVAQVLKEKLDARVRCLTPKKAYSTKGFAKYFWGGKSAVMAFNGKAWSKTLSGGRDMSDIIYLKEPDRAEAEQAG